MNKVLRITDDLVQIGFRDGTLKEYPLTVFNYPVQVGDIVDIYENENRTTISRNDLVPNPNAKTSLAGWSLALGITAIVLPIPIIDIALGVLGLILSRQAKQSGVRGLATAGFVLSIIGTVLAAAFTLDSLTGNTFWNISWDVVL